MNKMKSSFQDKLHRILAVFRYVGKNEISFTEFQELLCNDYTTKKQAPDFLLIDKHRVYNSHPMLAQDLKKACELGYLEKTKDGKYKISEDHHFYAIKSFDITILESYPVGHILVPLEKSIAGIEYPGGSRLYGFSKKLFEYYNNHSQDYRISLDKAMDTLEKISNELDDLKYAVTMDFLHSKFEEKCRSKKDKKFTMALEYDNNNPFLFQLFFEITLDLIDLPNKEKVWHYKKLKEQLKKNLTLHIKSKNNRIKALESIDVMMDIIYDTANKYKNVIKPELITFVYNPYGAVKDMHDSITNKGLSVEQLLEKIKEGMKEE